MQTQSSRVGLLMIPLMLSRTMTAAAAGRYSKRTGRYKLPPLIGLPLAVAALIALGLASESISTGGAAILLMMFCFGIGPLFPITMVAAQNAVEPNDIGTVPRALGFSRALGAARFTPRAHRPGHARSSLC